MNTHTLNKSTAPGGSIPTSFCERFKRNELGPSRAQTKWESTSRIEGDFRVQ